MLEKVRKTIEKYKMLEKGDKVLVALSGGPDSVAMLYALKSLSIELDFEIYVFHLNHKLRGEDSFADANFARELSEQLELPAFIEDFEVGEYIKKEGLSLQEGARKIRYQLLESRAKELGANKIAIGQNADDQAETIMMRFLRGAGLNGLAGITPVRENRYIRPLIETWRIEIENFLREQKISFRIDQSNLKPVYLRNKIRLGLLPLIEEEYNPSIKQVLFQMGEVLREENNYLEEKTKEMFKRLLIEASEDKIEIKKKEFLLEPLVMQRRLLRLAWEKINGNVEGLNYVNIEGALNFINEGLVGGGLNLPKGLCLKKGYESFALEDKKEKKENKPSLGNYFVKVPGITEVTEEGVRVKTEIVEGSISLAGAKEKLNEEISLDYNKIKNPLVLRARRPGDVFSPLEGRGQKKLKEYFIDLKIPREERDSILLLAEGNSILWVVGYSYSKRYKVDSGTKNIIKIKLDKN